MEKVFSIKGMSCDGCRSKIEKKLNEIEGISASVQLDPPVAIIHSERDFSEEELQEKLEEAGNYSIEHEAPKSGCCSAPAGNSLPAIGSLQKKQLNILKRNLHAALQQIISINIVLYLLLIKYRLAGSIYAL